MANRTLTALPRAKIREIERKISRKKDGLIACLELSEKARVDISMLEAVLSDIRVHGSCQTDHSKYVGKCPYCYERLPSILSPKEPQDV